MRYIVIVISIIAYWFLIGQSLMYLSNDTTLEEISLSEDNNYTFISRGNITTLEMVTDEPSGTSTLKTFINTLKTMFFFKNPTQDGIPEGIVLFISFVDWFLLILLGISVYRIANPVSGG